MPAVIGRAIDRGVAARDRDALLKWALVLLLIGLVQAATGIMRHRFAVTNWLIAAYRTVQLVTRQTVNLGGTLPRKVSTGEVVAIGTSDLSHLGQVMDVTARFAGAIVSFLLVSVILLSTSVTLGLVVLIGVPLLMLLVGPLLSPLQQRSARQRSLMGVAGQHRQRHRRRAAGAARHRRRAGLPRPLPPRVAADPPGRRRGRQAAVGARGAAGVPAGRLRGRRGLARRPVRRRRPDHARRAGRVLRLLGVPDDPAADRHRVRQQGDPGPRRRAPRLPRPRAHAGRRSSPRSPRRRRPSAPACTTSAPASACAPAGSPRS